MSRNPSLNPSNSETFSYFTIPFFGFSSIQLAKRLKTLSKKANKNIKFAFCSMKVGALFSMKDTTPKTLKAGVVYKYTCSDDQNVTYIGQTKRHLGQRAKEHGRFGPIADHRASCVGCEGDFINNFSILDNDNNYFKLSIKEACFIKHFNPKLNSSLVHSGSSYFLKVFN